MTRRKWLAWLLAFAVSCGAAEGPAAGRALIGEDFKIGPDALLDSLAIAAGSQNYLVVWRDLRAGENVPQMRGVLVSPTGVVTPDFGISGAASLPQSMPVQRIRAAFDGENFLAVWRDGRSGIQIHGALVSRLGAVVGGSDFLISATALPDASPQVVFTGSDYLVAWEDLPLGGGSGNRQISFTRVTKAGTVGAAIVLPDANVQPAQTLEILAAGAAGETLLVFQDQSSTPHHSRATRIAPDNSFAGDPLGALLFADDLTAAGLGVPVGAAFNGGDYLILSSRGAQLDSSVFLSRLKPDGRVLRGSNPFVEVGQGSTDLAENNYPRSAFNGHDEFLFLRNDQVSATAYHLLFKRVTTAGVDRDPNLQLIDSANGGVLNGAVAAASGSTYLVVWMDGRRLAAVPPRQTNIYGVFLDGSQAGDTTKPFLKATALASPTQGNSPLTVNFATNGSTGIVDSILWDFGDGSTANLGVTTHQYTTKGDYTATLSLFHAGFAFRDYVRILIDSDQPGGLAGPPQTLGGTLGPVSAGVNTQVILTSLSATLNFAKPRTDSVRVLGWFDPTALPVSMKDKTLTLVLAGQSYSFQLAADGSFFSKAGSKPFLSFQTGLLSGAFQFTSASDDMAGILSNLGATNETASKRPVSIPLHISLAALDFNAPITTSYTATAQASGKALYQFGVTGQTGAGYCHIFSASAKENVPKTTGKVTAKFHAFTVGGHMGLANGVELAKAAAGNWRLTFGNFIEDIPVTAITSSGDIYSFKSGKKKIGITQFLYNRKNGAFAVTYNALPAEGENPSGMALASSAVVRASMAFSADFDLEDGTKFQASAYVRLRRAAGKPKWTF